MDAKTRTRKARLKNITITLDDETAAWARVQAAERGMSLSRFVGEVLRAQGKKDDTYAAAYRAWRAEKPLDLKGPWKPYPRREELYDRPVFRRR